MKADWPELTRVCSTAVAIVDLPEPERPVIQIVAPLVPRALQRSSRLSWLGWKVMLVATGTSVSATAGTGTSAVSPAAPMIIPAATVRLVAGSTRMKLPVLRLSR